MKIVIMHRTVTNHDAIGCDIEQMFRVLNPFYECWVYAENRFNPHVPYLDLDSLEEQLGDSDLVLIYHHSIYWEMGEELLRKTKGKIIFRYHNITPPALFVSYSESYVNDCEMGRLQTVRLQQEFQNAFWLSDSVYNSEELTLVPGERKGVCPPFNKIETWAKKIPDEKLLRELIETPELNLMFVGRIVPNKGHLKLFEILRAYCSYYDTDVRLRIIGKFDEGIAPYNTLLMEKLEKYGLTDIVDFIGEINDNTLMSYYLGSDIFLCLSEHEGFCVPVVEAQYFGTPVVALASTAVPETIGKEQIVLPDSAVRFAAALHLLKTNQAYQEYIIQKGRENFAERFTFAKIRERFLEEFENRALR